MIYPPLSIIIKELRKEITQYFQSSDQRIVNFAKRILLIILMLSLLIVIITKSLVPGGEHDYYTHYFPYYLETLKQGNLAPNNVWYHFDNSKGASLVFYGILLSDPLAPSLVSLC